MTNLMDLLTANVPTCPYRLRSTPFWRCDLPAGHHGDHASVHVNKFPRDDAVIPTA